MNQEKHNLANALAALQTAANAMSPGADRVAMQSAVQLVILRSAQAHACGELRVGIEVPAAT